MGGGSCTSLNHYGLWSGCWSAGETIRLNVPAQNYDAVAAAAGDWNQYLTQHSASPRFAVSTGFGDILVHVTGTGSGGWCGNYSETRDTIYMRRTCGGHTGSFAATMKHELANLLGWNENESFEGNENLFSPGMTSICTVHLQPNISPKQINSTHVPTRPMA